MITESAGSASDEHWNTVPLRLLVAHIVSSYHGSLKKELPALRALLDDLAAREEGGSSFAKLSELLLHVDRRLELLMHKEESTLFRTIVDFESQPRVGVEADIPSYGSVANLVGALSRENRMAAAAMEEAAAFLEKSVTMCGASPELSTVSGRLALLRKNLQRHLYLEQSILYPRAIELEKNRTRA